MFSNVIPFNLRNSFCTCSGTNANAKPLLYPISNSLVCLSYMFLWGIWLILDQIIHKDDQLWCQNWIFIFFFIQFFALFHFSFTRWLFLSLYFFYYFISCWKFLVGNFCWEFKFSFQNSELHLTELRFKDTVKSWSSMLSTGRLKLIKVFRITAWKCPNTEFFLVRIFLYSGQIQKNIDQKKLHI